MGAAFGVDLSPLRLVVDSTLPAYLGAQALARGTEIHLAPGAPAAGSPAGRHLLAHEVAHLIQQNDRRVVPTTVVGGVALSTDAGLERAADAAAARFVRGEPAVVAQRGVLGAPPLDPVGQLYPPANVEEADKELADVERQLFGPGRSVTWNNKYGQHVVKLEKPGARGLRRQLGMARGSITAADGIDVGKAEELVDLWLKLKQWKESDFRSQGGFGFGQVPSAYFLPPSPLQSSFGFNPFAPQLHGLPFSSLAADQSLEELGDDLVVRERSAESLADMRKRSKAYKPPSKKRKMLDEPTFGADILSGESELDARRVGLWGTQKRGKVATVGILAGTGQKWGDQQKALGMSANDTVASAKHMLGLELDDKIPYQWLHLFAFSIGGIDASDPQNPRNFVIGSAHANYYHQIFESAAKSLAKQHNVVVTCEALEPVSVLWRIYRKLRYTFRLTGGIPFPWRMVMREIDILATPPVHAGDAKGLKEEILASLGFPTAEYLGAFDKLASAAASSAPGARLPSLSDELSMVVVDAEEEEDEQMAWALTDSVQQIARNHGVTAHYRVGHADGKDHNCSILSVFAAAGVSLGREQAEDYRQELARDLDEQLIGDIDLNAREGAPAAYLLSYLQRDYDKNCALRVLRPTIPGAHASDLLAGESGSPEILVFYASGHFSPAWPA